MPLFVKKSNDEGQDFYFMGMLQATKASFVQEWMDNDKKISVVKCLFTLEPPVAESLYQYIKEPLS